MKMVVSRIEFRPVGQGAFIRGQVKIKDFASQGPIKHFRWVYDCGADAKKEIIDASVHDLATDWTTKEALDVLVISHFDKDHISGLPTLLTRYKFRRILMPHLPRLVRLCAVLEHLAEENMTRAVELLDFADDPLRYVNRMGGDDVTQIVLVDAPESQEPPGQEESDDVGDNTTTALPESDYGEQTRPDTTGKGGLRLISSGRPLIRTEMWELVPYVDAAARTLLNFATQDHSELESKLKDIWQARDDFNEATENARAADDSVKQAQNDVVAAKKEVADAELSKDGVFINVNLPLRQQQKVMEALLVEENEALKAAKKTLGETKKKMEREIGQLKTLVYAKMHKAKKRAQRPSREAALDRKRGLTAEEKNAISLMIYMGAITERGGLTCAKVGAGYVYDSFASPNLYHEGINGDGFLLTGDAGLRDAEAVDQLMTHLTRNRIKRLAVLQVPHHGSKNNSSQYTASKLFAPFNVMNANPFGRYGHPHEEVVKLFSGYPHKQVSLANARAFDAFSVVTAETTANYPHEEVLPWLWEEGWLW
ncbi:hypothetical protein [Dyella flagellata]|uniref:Metallo-beta-lactamase superfamily protein n=1 Tax=Dyella flagellata TaxID=1867833 RepID=A0ABQ5XAR9_9GAMM|nr:hypothetical protein [Dyella flagellata]GLQ87718.1 hypothetical protein GCM10007898_12850 [Dyella flagellata]